MYVEAIYYMNILENHKEVDSDLSFSISKCVIGGAESKGEPSIPTSSISIYEYINRVFY